MTRRLTHTRLATPEEQAAFGLEWIKVYDDAEPRRPADVREARVMDADKKTMPSDGATAAGTTGDPLLQFFRYDHLPEHLRAVSAPFGVLAQRVVENLPRNAERTVALRKLLAAKDAAVRCVLFEG